MAESRPPGVVTIRCPDCNRWLQDVRDYGRCVCPNCGCEIVYRSREERRRDAAKPFLETPEGRMPTLDRI